MKRKDALAFAGVEEKAYESLRNRKQLPYDDPGAAFGHIDDANADALRLAVTLTTIGIGLPAACRLVRNNRRRAEQIAELIANGDG